MDIFKKIIIQFGVPAICFGLVAYGQFQIYTNQANKMAEQMGILQQNVASLQAQVYQMNQTINWMRDRWFK